MKTVAQHLVDRAWALNVESIPEEVRHAATRHVLDGLGNALASHRLRAVPHVESVALGFASPEEATVIGSRRRIPAHMAAFANGGLIHGLDFDDTHGAALVHPTSCVLPSALAAAEERSATGNDFVEACVIGYETVIRLGAAVRHGFHARGFHATSVCGVFGASLAAARLYGLDPHKAVHALGIAGSFASGSLEFLATGAATKQLQPGWAAMAGVMAARLAEAGATGPETVFEGRNGLYRSYAAADVDPTAILMGFGDEWKSTSITVKPYPVCQLSHASLDALLRARVRVSADNVQGVTFDVPSEAVPIICSPYQAKVAPRSAYEARFSLPWCAATLLIDGELTIDSFESNRMGRADILAMSAKMTYRAYDSEMTAADAPGRAEVTTRDGDLLRFEVPQSRGSAALPLTDDELIEKFVANCGGEDRAARALAQVVFGVTQLDEVTPLIGGPSLATPVEVV